MGGEKGLTSSVNSPSVGSPPHGRGKGVVNGRAGLLVGITPAWAGKRRCTAACNGLCWDHPRMGGEKVQILLYEDIQKGSPPRGRGKVAGDEIPGDVLGITPAHAGKRTRSWRAYGCPWDHPRVGGEKFQTPGVSSSVRGSPPHGRGKVHSVFKVRKHHRITPA